MFALLGREVRNKEKDIGVQKVFSVFWFGKSSMAEVGLSKVTSVGLAFFPVKSMVGIFESLTQEAVLILKGIYSFTLWPLLYIVLLLCMPMKNKWAFTNQTAQSAGSVYQPFHSKGKGKHA